MMRTWMMIALMAVMAAPASAQERIKDRMAARTATRDLKVTRDVAYGTHAAQKMDVYTPKFPKNAPVIVFAHGGGWRIGDKTNANAITNKIPHWVRAGAIVASINYRMLPTDVYTQAQDVTRAIGYVQKNAGKWGGDAGRMAIIGHSAGAHLILLAASDPALYAYLAPWRATVALDSAAYDVAQLMRLPHLKLYDDAFGTDERFWRKVSPQEALNGKTAPALLVCSSQRREACPVAEAYAAKARSLGNSVQVSPQNMTHEQINANLGVPGAYTDTVDAFLKAQGVF